MRILTLSLNAWNNTMATGNTFTNFFANISNEDELANLYCRNEPIDNALCKKYFRITEKDIIKNLFTKNRCGTEIYGDFSENIRNTESSQRGGNKKILNFFRKNRFGIFLFIRELIWSLNIWKNKKLISFLDNYKPDCIYMHGHNNLYMHKLLWFCKNRTNAKVVVFFGDDMYNYKEDSLLNKLFQYTLRKQLKYTIEQADAVLGGSPKLCEEYSQMFNTVFHLQIKTCTNIKVPTYDGINHKPFNIVYAGNLLYGRDAMLAMLATTIKKLNINNKNYLLHIYSASLPDKDIMAILDDKENSIMEGGRPFDKICQILDSADLLLFTESFDNKYKNQTRLSFSTKIIDYYQAKPAILAFGPSEVSSIDYLQSTGTAFVANNTDELYNILSSILQDETKLEQSKKNKYDFAKANHTEPTLLKIMKKVVFNY